jgi:hypothetical protein
MNATTGTNYKSAYITWLFVKHWPPGSKVGPYMNVGPPGVKLAPLKTLC